MAIADAVEIPLADRLVPGGFVSIAEVCALKRVSKSTVYLDIKEGLLPVEKFGALTRIAGLIARDYRPRRGVVKAEAA